MPRNDRAAGPEAALAQLWHRSATDGREPLDEPLRAFPSWFLRITCDRCGKDRMLSETHTPQGDMRIRDIIARMRYGRAWQVEVLTGIEGASSRPVRRILLIDG